MPEQTNEKPILPLEVETQQTTEVLYFFNYAKKGRLTIASDHLLVGKGTQAAAVRKEDLREATWLTDGFLGLDLSYWNGDSWHTLALPFGVQNGLPVRDL